MALDCFRHKKDEKSVDYINLDVVKANLNDDGDRDLFTGLPTSTAPSITNRRITIKDE